MTNSAALLQPDGHISVVYDKANLIPYSEWLPSFLSAGKTVQYKAGSTPQSIGLGQLDRPGHAWTAGVFICFESTFPGYLRKVMINNPDLLINLSDDAWFGDGAEPEQHLAQAVLRAIESRGQCSSSPRYDRSLTPPFKREKNPPKTGVTQFLFSDPHLLKP